MPSKRFAHAYPVIVIFLRFEFAQVVPPFNTNIAVFKRATFLKDNVHIGTFTQLTVDRNTSVANWSLDPLGALAIAIKTTIFCVYRLQNIFAA